jgi:hypothetical protein
MMEVQYDEFAFKDVSSIASDMSLSSSRIVNHSKFLEVYYDLHHVFRNSGNTELKVLSRIKCWMHKYNENLKSVPAMMLHDDGELDRLASYVRRYAHPTGKTKY